MNNKPVFQKVSADDAGLRLDKWFRRNHAHISHGLLEKLLRKGGVKIDGKKAKSSDKVEQGQEIRVPYVEENAEGMPPKPIKLNQRDAEKYLLGNIIYQDKNVIAINKPAGLATQGGSGIRVSVDGLLEFLKTDGKRPKLVHRIDKDTSGVLLLAKTAQAATELTGLFKSKKIEKTYWAIVVGEPIPKQGRIDMPIEEKKPHGMTEKSAVSEDGKPAITYYSVVEKASKKLSWLALRPITGRTHQLRVHMAEIGHPVLGDGKYGAKDAFINGLSNQMHLHARRIVIPDLFGKRLDVTAKLPPHMQKTFKMFEFEEALGENPFEEL